MQVMQPQGEQRLCSTCGLWTVEIQSPRSADKAGASGRHNLAERIHERACSSLMLRALGAPLVHQIALVAITALRMISKLDRPKFAFSFSQRRGGREKKMKAKGAAPPRSTLTFPGKGGHRGGGESADPIFFDRTRLIHS
jgi:hypothetical protein